MKIRISMKISRIMVSMLGQGSLPTSSLNIISFYVDDPLPEHRAYMICWKSLTRIT